MKKTLTIFTPTYNRAYILNRCYESLKKQTSQDFIWLIIDDGSSDNTKELVSKWIEEDMIQIKYYYQENQGMHGAHNTAYELIDTELNVCIDSDDYMPYDGVEKILKFWECNRSDKIAGFVGLDQFKDGSIVGSKLPIDVKSSTLFDLYYKYGVKGDKKLVYRSEVTKKYPYPVFEGEKLVPLSYKYRRIDLEYKLLLFNEPLCVVEYMEDGSSKNIFKQYKKSPKGFAAARIENIKNPSATLKFKIKENMHYISSSIFSKNYKFIKESPTKLITILSIPLGILLHGYVLFKIQKLD